MDLHKQLAGAQQSAAARQFLRRVRSVCYASQQLLRPSQYPSEESSSTTAQPAAGAVTGIRLQQQQAAQPNAAAQYHQQLQRPQQPQGQLLAKPSMGPLQQQQEQGSQRASSKRKVLLDDADARMAAFDQLTVQVTCPKGVAKPAVAVSFNNGPARMRPVMATNLKAARINRPTPLQGHMIPAILAGHDVLAAGPPSAGTSTAALLSVICRVLSTPRTIPKNKAMPLGLVLCPSRELAMQLAAEGTKLVAGTQLTVKCVTGGAELAQQAIDLRMGADVLVCTSGRLMDLLTKKVISLARVKHLVMEDIDELMGPLLLPITLQVLHHHTMATYQQRQTIALGSSALPQQQLLAASTDALRPSAIVIRAAWPLPEQQQNPQQLDGTPAEPQRQATGTVLNPDPASLASLVVNPTKALAVSAAAAASAIPPTVTQRFLGVAPQLKMRFLLRLLSASDSGAGGLVLVFTNSHTAAEDVWQQLDAAGISAGVLHYARSQTQRDEALQCFKYGVTQVLVACGIGYRGLDLPDVAQVINYDIPLSLAEYARRLGRAGRAGRQGVGTTLVTPSDGTAVAPLVAVLRASGQLVPDWLLSVADNSIASENGIPDSSAAADGGSAAAVTPGDGLQQLQQLNSAAEDQGLPTAAAVGDSEDEGSADAGGSEDGSKQQQLDRLGSSGIGGSMFKMSRRGRRKAQFGSYLES